MNTEPAGQRLESWKEIAAHFGRDLGTLQRWEKSEGLPIHRHQHAKQGSVYAYVAELDAWRASRNAAMAAEVLAPAATEKVVSPPAPGVASRASHAFPVWIGVLLCAAVLIAGAIWLTRPPAPSNWDDALIPQPLTSNPGDEVAPAFSPDGKQIAFSWSGEREDNYDIYIAVPGSSQLRRLTAGPEAEYSPAWSPDGRSIAYLQGAYGGYAALMIVPASGGAPRKVADTFEPTLPQGRAIDWSPDGKWIAVEDSVTPNEPLAIFLVSVENGEKRRLTTPPAGTTDLQPAFSPDERQLAFARDVGKGVSVVEILALGPNLAASGEPRPLSLPAFKNVIVAYPRWFSNGIELIVTASRGGSDRLWQVSASGPAEPKLLASLGDSVSYPAVSPVAHKLAFSRLIEDTNIWAVLGDDLERKASKLISSTQLDQSPHFSPDGSRTVFQSNRSGSSEIWSCARDGSDTRQLTKCGGPITGSPSWSPDGRWIAFDSRVDGQPEIYVTAATGGQQRRVTFDPAADVLPSWSADSKWIYFCSNRTGKRQIWRVAAKGGDKAEQVTREGGFASVPSPDGKTIYYTKDRSPVTSVWRVPAGGGPETMVMDAVAERCFVLARGRLYFIAAHADQKALLLRYLDLSSGETVTLKTLTEIIAPGLAVSPDGAIILFTQLDRHGSNVMVAGMAR